jgi:hypothetical protein
MSRYFLHLRDHVDELRDTDGLELADLEAVKRAVISAARDVMCGDLRNGILDLRYQIDAEDAAGTLVYSMPFQHAVSIIPPVQP